MATSYLTSVRPGERFELEAAGARAQTLAPGVASAGPPKSSLPGWLDLGLFLLSLIVGGCVLVGMPRHPRAGGAALRRQLAPTSARSLGAAAGRPRSGSRPRPAVMGHRRRRSATLPSGASCTA